MPFDNAKQALGQTAFRMIVTKVQQDTNGTYFFEDDVPEDYQIVANGPASKYLGNLVVLQVVDEKELVIILGDVSLAKSLLTKEKHPLEDFISFDENTRTLIIRNGESKISMSEDGTVRTNCNNQHSHARGGHHIDAAYISLN